MVRRVGYEQFVFKEEEKRRGGEEEERRRRREEVGRPDPYASDTRTHTIYPSRVKDQALWSSKRKGRYPGRKREKEKRKKIK